VAVIAFFPVADLTLQTTMMAIFPRTLRARIPPAQPLSAFGLSPGVPVTCSAST
jgi:hypothetical protein